MGLGSKYQDTKNFSSQHSIQNLSLKQQKYKIRVKICKENATPKMLGRSLFNMPPKMSIFVLCLAKS